MNTAKSKLSAYAAIPYLCFFLLLSAWAVVQPQYTWDLVGYIGASVDSTHAEAIHRVTFDAIKPISSDKDIQPDNPYRADVTANPYHFAEQLPFYSIKPAYVALIRGFHRLGLPFPKAAVAISAVSNFLLALLLWRWLSAYLSGLPALGYRRILTEGGPHLLGEITEAGLLDELCLTVSPLLSASGAGRIIQGAGSLTDARGPGSGRLSLAHVLEDQGYLLCRYLRPVR